MNSATQRQKKLLYEKPRLRAIDLAADEVLAVGCKAAGKSASGVVPCWTNNCSLQGS